MQQKTQKTLLIEAKAVYQEWVQHQALDADTRKQLDRIAKDDPEILERFSKNLSFGTGGLRGILGAGTNRMNHYTVTWATKGICQYLEQLVLPKKQQHSVCIAYDTRHYSKAFAKTVAQVLYSRGMLVRLFGDVRPTPMLSFAVRYYHADAGVVITASHNPKEYNGYKIYGSDGGQITDEVAEQVSAYMANIKILPQYVEASSDHTTATLQIEIGEELDRAYTNKVKELVLQKNLVAQYASELRILYTPLHGTGNIPVRRVLRELGFSQLQVVESQTIPDGAFPTVKSPNPEEEEVFSLAKQQAKQQGADIIFATDPDCDRIGVQVRTQQGDFAPLTGNQVGALLCEYLLSTQHAQGAILRHSAILKTIVTTDLAKKICHAYEVPLYETLTGFKYMGEQLGRLFPSETPEQPPFVFCFEESCGYLAGTFVRDKDAVIASVLISEMALYYHTQGMSLLTALQVLYQKYGYTQEKLLSWTLTGALGRQQIDRIMQQFRENDPSTLFEATTLKLSHIEDYRNHTRTIVADQTIHMITLPTSNVIKLCFEEGGFVVVRPSGTEPKLKIYLAVCGKDEHHARHRMKELEDIFAQMVSGI